MADEADRAQIDIDLEQGLLSGKAAVMANKARLTLTGFCHNCEEETAALFCDVSCRDDYDKRAKAMQITGNKGGQDAPTDI